uniref:LBH domain-containing protein n=1 Tax=Acanthochromis polyacanthus TaxID=80966 RepID=A0A3Q1EXR2_9TELE
MQRKEQRLPFQVDLVITNQTLSIDINLNLVKFKIKCQYYSVFVLLKQVYTFLTSLNSLDHDHEKERLPSIVVEPTEVSEVESGELRWPPENMDMDEDEEDLFLEESKNVVCGKQLQ